MLRFATLQFLLFGRRDLYRFWIPLALTLTFLKSFPKRVLYFMTLTKNKGSGKQKFTKTTKFNVCESYAARHQSRMVKQHLLGFGQMPLS